MVDPRKSVRLDGQAEALALLRNLQRLNWVHNQRRKSVELLHNAIDALTAWPERERVRFLRVISDWLVEELLGCCPDLDDYEAYFKRRGAATDAKRDRRFREFLNAATRAPSVP